MGNYHHHQNPSAFKLDLNVLTDICNLYDADGLYAIDPDQHSPLIGYAYDGFPIYGAYGYKNIDGTGGVIRIKSGYQLRNITQRAEWADGTDVEDGPDINTTYPIGYFREDYEYIEHTTDQEYLDVHNGRFAVTPEYPNGIYAYYATVDENWNSAYPYVVGPTFYGESANRKITTVPEPTTVFTDMVNVDDTFFDQLKVSVFPNPTSDLVAIQIGKLVDEDLVVDLIDLSGRILDRTTIPKGSTIAYFDIQTIYEGSYLIKISNGTNNTIEKVSIIK